MNKTLIMLILSLIVTGCTPPPKPPRLDTSSASLAEASFNVSRSMVSLAETAQASHPLPDLAPPPSPASIGMAGLATIDWSGPVEPLVKQIAKVSNYRIRVLGNEPAIPVLITIYSKNTMLADILRDVGFQCGRRATIVVYPESRVIELRYSRN